MSHERVVVVVQSKCEPVLERFNFKWPAVLDCSGLPDGDADRSQLCIDPPAASDQLDDALGPQGHAPANSLHLRQLLEALRSHNSSSGNHIMTSSGNHHSTVMTSRDSVGVCSPRYVMTHDTTITTSSSSLCRPRCGVDVLYRANDKRFELLRWCSLYTVSVTTHTMRACNQRRNQIFISGVFFSHPFCSFPSFPFPSFPPLTPLFLQPRSGTSIQLWDLEKRCWGENICSRQTRSLGWALNTPK